MRSRSFINTFQLKTILRRLVSTHAQDFCHFARSLPNIEMDEDANPVSDLSADHAVRRLGVSHQRAGDETLQAVGGRIRVRRGERSAMASVQGLEQFQCLLAAYLSHDDPV